MKSVWITGAAGFSGRHLITHLRSLPEPLHLVGLDHRPATVSGLDAFHAVDLTDSGALRALAAATPPDRVIHLAGVLPPAPDADLWRINVGATLALMLALAPHRRPSLRVLSVGSAAEYLPCPDRKIAETSPCGGTSPYGRSKWAQSLLALSSGRELGIHVSVARTFNLLGPGLSPSLVAGALCAQFARPSREPIRVGNLRPIRDFVDIRDAVAAYWTLCERGRAGRAYNVCTGQATRIQTVVTTLSNLAGNSRPLEQDPARMRVAEVDRVCGDPARLRSLGWKPRYSVRRSLRDMFEAACSA